MAQPKITRDDALARTPLDAWLRQRGMSDTEFAARIGVSRQSVSLLRKGARRPAEVTLARIRQVTENALTADDFDRAWRKQRE